MVGEAGGGGGWFGQVLGRQGRRTGEVGQFEQVFGEGIIVVRNTSEEWKCGNKRKREGGWDQVTGFEGCISCFRL